MQYDEDAHDSYPDSRLSSSAGSASIEIVGNRMNTSFLQAQWASWVDDSMKDVCVCGQDVHSRDNVGEDNHVDCTHATTYKGDECNCHTRRPYRMSDGPVLPHGSDSSTWSVNVTPHAHSLSADKLRCALPAVPVLEEDVEDEDVELTLLNSAACAKDAVMTTNLLTEVVHPSDFCTSMALAIHASHDDNPVKHMSHEVLLAQGHPSDYVDHSMSDHTSQTNRYENSTVRHKKDGYEEDEDEEAQYLTDVHDVSAAIQDKTLFANMKKDDADGNWHCQAVGITDTHIDSSVVDGCRAQHDTRPLQHSRQKQTDDGAALTYNDKITARGNEAVAHTTSSLRTDDSSGTYPPHPLAGTRLGYRALECVNENDDSAEDEEEEQQENDCHEPRASQEMATACSAQTARDRLKRAFGGDAAGGVQRIEQDKQDFYGCVIGRGGDRGSCVYRVCRDALPALRFGTEIDAIDVKGGQRHSNVQYNWLAQKVYPRQMLRNEVEFTETVSLWRRAHQSGAHKIPSADVGCTSFGDTASALHNSNHEQHALVRSCACVECRCCEKNSSHVCAYAKDSAYACVFAADGVAYSPCEECYAAHHLVLPEAIVVIDHEDRGVIMPLYDCSLKDFLLRIGAQSHSGDDTANHIRNNNLNSNRYHSTDCGYSRTASDGCCPGDTAAHPRPHIHNSLTASGLGRELGAEDDAAFAAATCPIGQQAVVCPDSVSPTEANGHRSRDNESNSSCRSSSSVCRKDGGVTRRVSQSSAFLYRRSYLPVTRTTVISAIVFQLLVAVAWMHDRLPHRVYGGTLCTGYVHNDIHLSNILLDARSGRVALCDFELVSHASTRRGRARMRRMMVVNEVGSRLPPYSRQSPHGLLCPEADTWAVGLVILNLLTGIDPFVSNEAIMDDFGDGPLLMSFSSPDRPVNTPVLDWESNMHDHVLGLLANRGNYGEAVDRYKDAEMSGLLEVCAGCFANSASAQPSSARELFHHAVFDRFRRRHELAESTVLEWIHSHAAS